MMFSKQSIFQDLWKQCSTFMVLARSTKMDDLLSLCNGVSTRRTMDFEISCPDISAVAGTTAPFSFLFFTTTHLNLNHNFYSETSVVLVLGTAYASTCIVHWLLGNWPAMQVCISFSTNQVDSLFML